MFQSRRSPTHFSLGQLDVNRITVLQDSLFPVPVTKNSYEYRRYNTNTMLSLRNVVTIFGTVLYLFLYLLLIALGDFLAEWSEMLRPSCALMTQDVISEVLLIT